nr:prevent-host-death protein [Neorhizobium sp. T6_25]
MQDASSKNAEAGLSSFVDHAAAGESVTTTRHGKAAAVIVEAAEVAGKARPEDGSSLVQYLRNFHLDADIDDDVFTRNSAPSREADL